MHWVSSHFSHYKKPAVVLDIDDTSLSTWAEEKAMDFGYVPTLWDKWERSASAPAIPATLKLFRYAKSHGIAVFFVTGRPDASRAWTVANLEKVGYVGYQKLYMRPSSDRNPSVSPFKAGCRKAITRAGYTILANLGDQKSDLTGGYSQRSFKLPNPMYIIK
jgi:predicted secreted acid phosphatase